MPKPIDESLRAFVIDSWYCQACSEVHDSKREAQECCPPVPTHSYKCTTCGEIYEADAPEGFKAHREVCRE